MAKAGSGGHPKSLDPAKDIDDTTIQFALNFYDQLVTIDPDSYNLTPLIATDWEIEDSTTWVFNIREGVTFHSGNTLTAEDIKYSMNRYSTIGQGPVGLWRDLVDNTEVRGDYTVAFNLSKPFQPFGPSLVRFHIVDSKIAQENEKDGEHGEHGDYAEEYLKRNPAGSGPYQLDGWDQGSEINLKYFDGYWQEWSANDFRTVDHKLYPETSVLKQALINGDVHYSTSTKFMGPDSWQQIDQSELIEMKSRESLLLFMKQMNTRKAPTDDLELRKAIAHAFDYESAITDVFGVSTDLIAEGPVPGIVPQKNEDLEPYGFDLDKAKEHLDKSEYSVEEINDIGLEMVVLSGLDVERQTGLIARQGLKELGVNLEIIENSWAQMTGKAQEVETTPHMLSVYHSGTTLSPDDFTYGMHHPDSQGTYFSASWYSNEELIQTIEDARSTTSAEESARLYKKAQELIWEAYPGIYILYPPAKVAVQKNLGGWKWKGVDGLENKVSDWHWEG